MEASPPPVISSKKRFVDFSIEALLSNKNDSRGKVRLRNNSNFLQDEIINVTCSDDSSESEVDVDEFKKESDCASDISREKCDQDKRNFAWLTCTRFKPPKLLRSRKKSCPKRNGRGPRIPFSSHQLAVLEQTFIDSQYLSGDSIVRLAENLHLTETRVKIWFQNRRARFRREKNSTISTNSQLQLPANKTSKPSKSKRQVPAIPSKQQSFRHLINDLNLMAASASPSTNVQIGTTYSFDSHSQAFHIAPIPTFAEVALHNNSLQLTHSSTASLSSSVR